MSTFALVDSHAHVQFAAYEADREAVVERAHRAGIGIVNIGTQYSTSVDAIRFAEAYPGGIWATVGFHPGHLAHDTHHDPQELRERGQEHFDISKFKNLAPHPKVVAIGECGLDYYRFKNEDLGLKNRQQDVFAEQIQLALDIRKPLVIHCRQAFPDLIEVLKSKIVGHNSPTGVVHFFSGSWNDAQKLVDLGFYLGFGGVITFARDYDEVVAKAPLDRIVVETDAPYVAPVPYRGKRNEPSYVVETVRKIAELRGISYDEVADATTKSTRHLFRI